MIQKALLVMLGGAAGSFCRYWLAGIVQRLAGTGFPLGTFAVNLIGCFAFGALWGFLENRVGFSSELRLLLLTGFMGAFTTFSTYMFESANLMKAGQYLFLALNVGGQSALGLLLVLAGMTIGRML